MSRISFKLRMYQQLRMGQKLETRRVGGTPFMQGQILLVCHPHIRPKNGPFNPMHLQNSLNWVANEGCWAVELGYGPTEKEKSVPMGWKCMAGMYLPAWASSHAIKVKGTHREQLAAITEEGAKLEGFDTRRDFLKYVQDMRGGQPMGHVEVQVVKFEVLTIEQLHSTGTLKALMPEYDTSSWGVGWYNHLPKCMAQAMGVL